MFTHSRVLLASAALLASSALAAGGTVASYASATPTQTTTAASASPADGPNPNAPHVGVVEGVQTGPHIWANNAQNVRSFKTLHRGILAAQQGKAQPQSTKPYFHQWLGTSLDDTTDMIGSQADQSVSDTIEVNEHFTTLYTPTMYPTGGQPGGADGSCIEMSTMYHRNHNIVAAWDWCSAITFVAQVKINAKFMKTYTHKGFYSDQIVQTDASTNTWTSYLYNYKTGEWQQFYQQSGTARIGTHDGWDFYEIYSHWKPDGQAFSCKDLRGHTVQAKNIMVDDDGTWNIADPDHAGHEYDSPLSGFHCKDIAYKIITPYSHWKVSG